MDIAIAESMPEGIVADINPLFHVSTFCHRGKQRTYYEAHCIDSWGCCAPRQALSSLVLTNLLSEQEGPKSDSAVFLENEHY